MKSRSGFTLVELLVVIAVITILATITVITYSSVLDDAYDSRLKADASNIAKAINLYQSKYNVIPICSGGNGTSCNVSSLDFGSYTMTMPIPDRGQYIYVGNNTATVKNNWAVRAYATRTDSAYCKFGHYPNHPNWFSSAPNCLES